MILLHRFLQICLLRASPADLPASQWLLRLSLSTYFMVGVLVSHVDYDWRVSLVASFTDTVLLMLVCWGLLALRSRLGRYIQTATALAGTGSVIGILGMPIFWLFSQMDPQGQMTSLVLLLVLVVVFWSLLITAHILRQAMEIGAGLAAVITVLYTVVSLIVVGLAMSGVV